MTPDAAKATSEPADTKSAQAVPARRYRPRTWHAGTQPNEDQEAWLITYLDVITLILVMMVVMLAFAGPIGARFKSPPGSVQTLPLSRPPNIVPPLSLPRPPTRAESNPLAGLAVDGLGKQVEVIVDQNKVSFRISSELLFASGNAELVSGANDLLDRLVPILAKITTHSIVIEGHTDNVPIQTERYPSNWELSTSRAGTVVRYLISRGIAPQRLRATGYADTRPLAANDTVQARAANRRVELVLEAPQSEE